MKTKEEIKNRIIKKQIIVLKESEKEILLFQMYGLSELLARKIVNTMTDYYISALEWVIE
jgi:hypothetical protein